MSRKPLFSIFAVPLLVAACAGGKDDSQRGAADLTGPVASSATGSCRETLGADAANKLATECIEVSPATHPPCSIESACSLIQDEINRACGLLGAEAPAFCPPVTSGQRPPASGPSATVTTKEIKSDAKPCLLAVDEPVVDAADPAVNALIAAAFATHDATAKCKDLDPGQSADIQASFVVATNERGILAMTLSQSALLSGVDQPLDSTVGLTFDLRTGKVLALGDMLTAAGIAAANASCIADLVPSLDGDVDDAHGIAVKACGAATTQGSAGLTVEKGGLRLQLDLPHILEVFGGTLVPWSALTTGLKPGPVADFVAAIGQNGTAATK